MTQPKSREELLDELREGSPRSGERFKQAQSVLPGGLSSAVRIFEPHPFYTQRAQGSKVWDIDENEYLDCCMSYGVLILGHRPPVVIEALEGQLERGLIYGTPHNLEIEYAQKLVKCIPCADMMMFCNSGTEATMQGIRVMRAYTGKEKIAKFEGGFHGWHDYSLWSVNMHPEGMGAAEKPNMVLEAAGMARAAEETILVLPYEESAFALIEEHAHELAGVMIEPVLGGFTLPAEKAFLEKLREVTKKLGILLMFDEVITGFRLALGGAQEHYGVIPDLATYGKAIGGGLPIGAVGASHEIMESVTGGEAHFWVSGTFSGNPMTLAAGNATIGFLMDNQKVYDEMAVRGDHLRNSFNEFARAKGLPGTMTGIGSMFQVHLREAPVTKPRDLLQQDEEALRDFQLYLRLNGVFIPRIHLAFLSAVHSDEDVEKAITANQLSLEASVAAKN